MNPKKVRSVAVRFGQPILEFRLLVDPLAGSGEAQSEGTSLPFVIAFSRNLVIPGEKGFLETLQLSPQYLLFSFYLILEFCFSAFGTSLLSVLWIFTREQRHEPRRLCGSGEMRHPPFNLRLQARKAIVMVFEKVGHLSFDCGSLGSRRGVVPGMEVPGEHIQDLCSLIMSQASHQYLRIAT